MAHLNSPFLRTVYERGYVQDCTDRDALDARLAAGPLMAYVGYDCTADSLHVGHLISIMMLRHWQRTGNRPIVLMGGGTSQIGDPSGKDVSRQLLSKDEIAHNKASIQRVFARFLKFGDGQSDAIMADNADWLDKLQYIPFLRDVGRYFSVNRMLSFDSVKLRLEREQPLTFLEFNYMVLQAYDFLELSRRHDCAVQMGGSDQWGNIVCGVELGRRIESRSLFGLTAPLLTTASGAKMGKTAAGAVWLNAERLSPYDYWQFWRNADDADVGRFLRLFTDLPNDEIARLEKLPGNEINEAKKILANEATKLCHGENEAIAAELTARLTFADGGIGEKLPTIAVSQNELTVGLALIDALHKVGFAESLSAARRLVRGNGVRVNDATVTDEMKKLGLGDLNSEGVIKLSAGRKRHALIKPA